MQDSTRVRSERSTDTFSAFDETPFDEAPFMEEASQEEVDRTYRLMIRRGMARGAVAGFMLGLMPLTMMTIMGAFAGALISRASRLRIEKVSGPRIQFVRRTNHSSPD